jgi:hypothetical protein
MARAERLPGSAAANGNELGLKTFHRVKAAEGLQERLGPLAGLLELPCHHPRPRDSGHAACHPPGSRLGVRMEPAQRSHRHPWLFRGGKLAACAAMRNDPGSKDAADLLERQSSRPDFQALIYPGSSGSFKVEAGMPPVFLAAGYNDRLDIAEGLTKVFLM